MHLDLIIIRNRIRKIKLKPRKWESRFRIDLTRQIRIKILNRSTESIGWRCGENAFRFLCCACVRQWKFYGPENKTGDVDNFELNKDRYSLSIYILIFLRFLKAIKAHNRNANLLPPVSILSYYFHILYSKFFQSLFYIVYPSLFWSA